MEVIPKKTCVIIPCYNEESRFPIEDFLMFLSIQRTYELCFVNDGSTDNTLKILNDVKNKYPNTTVLNLTQNIGKAEAIRYGVLNIDADKYNYIGYLDADLSTSLDEMARLSNFISGDTTFILGSRVKKLGSIIIRSSIRHFFGRIFMTIVNNYILKVGIYDSQCGAKLIELTLAKEIFKKPFVSKWLFDIELLLRVIQLKGKDYFDNSIIEVPLIKWHDKGDSRIKIRDLLLVPSDLIKIKNKYL